MKILVAGIGNIFFGDDGWGSAMVAALQAHAWPAGVEIKDFGIRGMDLAFALTSGIDAAILVDAVARGGTPGTLYVIEPEPGANAGIETHALDPARVLGFAATLGPTPAFIRVIGCEPERLEAEEFGLSAAITASIDPAVALIGTMISELTCTS